MITDFKYQIEMIDVKDGDCFILYMAGKEDDDIFKKLVLIDAGHYESDESKLIQHLEKYYKNQKIDLAIVTHCDEDHFGGFINILEKDKNLIRKFLINLPSKHISKKDTNGINPDIVYSIKKSNNSTVNLIELIKDNNISYCEKFADENLIDDDEEEYPALFFLGPTKDYYEEIVKGFRFDGSGEKIDTDEDIEDDDSNEDSLSRTLDDADDDSSMHNQSSIIFAFMPDKDNIYLFTGDAGKDAFYKVPKKLQKYMYGIHWLKVPHHGSKHNLNSEILKIMNPKVAYISTEKTGKYLNQCTINALSKLKCRVYSTHKDRTSFLHNGFDGRDDYISAEPLNVEQLTK